MIFFHGTRAEFDVFDEAYIGTGEGDDQKAGFSVTESLYGAAYHAMKVDRWRPGEPHVYVCEIPDSVLYCLNRDDNIKSCGDRVVEKWRSSQVTNDLPIDSNQWFFELEKRLRDIGRSDNSGDSDEEPALRFLAESGFQLICNWEDYPEPSYDGSVHRLISYSDVEIIERHDALPFNVRSREKHFRYELSDTLEKLDDTGLYSRLRLKSKYVCKP